MRWFRNPFLNLQVSIGTFVQQTSFKYPTLCHGTIIFWVINTMLLAHCSVKGRTFPQRESAPSTPAPSGISQLKRKALSWLTRAKLKNTVLKSEQGREEFQNLKALAHVLVQLARRGLRERVLAFPSWAVWQLSLSTNPGLNYFWHSCLDWASSSFCAQTNLNPKVSPCLLILDKCLISY